MQWNWQLPQWPHLRFQPAALGGREAEVMQGSGIVVGTVRPSPRTSIYNS